MRACLLPNDDDGNGDDPIPPTFTDEQIDALAEALSQFRMELQNTTQHTIDSAVAPLRERISILEGSHQHADEPCSATATNQSRRAR